MTGQTVPLTFGSGTFWDWYKLSFITEGHSCSWFKVDNHIKCNFNFDRNELGLHFILRNGICWIGHQTSFIKIPFFENNSRNWGISFASKSFLGDFYVFPQSSALHFSINLVKRRRPLCYNLIGWMNGWVMIFSSITQLGWYWGQQI